MSFAVDDRVVCPAFGVGRIVGLVTKEMVATAGRQMYYEVLGERGTMWVQADASARHGLRRLTRKEELARYRVLLRRPPTPLSADKQQRQLALRDRLKRGTFKDLCELVRDLTAQGRLKPLNEADATALRRGREALCQEWAAAAGIPVADAAAEINALLQQDTPDRAKLS
jgi:RNA polymerase-interacting CarD/CdnL/TRCF family regulator